MALILHQLRCQTFSKAVVFSLAFILRVVNHKLGCNCHWKAKGTFYDTMNNHLNRGWGRLAVTAIITYMNHLKREILCRSATQGNVPHITFREHRILLPIDMILYQNEKSHFFYQYHYIWRWQFLANRWNNTDIGLVSYETEFGLKMWVDILLPFGTIVICPELCNVY